jgi:hypothetical protein
MSVGPEEARDMLQGVDDVTSRTKKMIAYGGGDVLFILWGIVWFIGGLGTHLMPMLAASLPTWYSAFSSSATWSGSAWE